MVNFVNRYLLIFSSVYLIFITPVLNAQVYNGKFVEAELIHEFQGVNAGVDASVALRLKPEKGWHLYWRYAGDSGASPILVWQINGQSVSSKIHWPIPEAIPFGALTNYGYSSEVILISDIPIPREVKGEVDIKLDAEWLVCLEECIPGNAKFQIKLPVLNDSESVSPSPYSRLFETFRGKLPKIENDLISTAVIQDGSLIINFSNQIPNLHTAHFFPYVGGIIKNSASQELSINDSSASLRLMLEKNTDLLSRQVQGVLVLAGNERQGYEVNFTPDLSINSQQSEQFSLVLMVLSALLGGLILNLMPCVFPVLSIKVLDFVNKAGSSNKEIRAHGFAFSFGVIISFWILAIIVRVIRGTGEQLGWGFQLQNPSFVSFLILLLIFLASNLFGLFEIGSSLQRAGGRVKLAGEGLSSSFFHGCLATVLATPCVAPFMGAAVAYALSATYLESFLVFTALGIGLSMPYLILSFNPKLLSVLPKPGVWMENFKQLMAFPLLLTAIWLISVLIKQVEIFFIVKLLFISSILFFALWIFGKFSKPNNSILSRRLSLLFLILICFFCFKGIIYKGDVGSFKHESSSVGVNEDGDYTDSYGLTWKKYSPELVAKIVNDGYPVYLDFTATWCVTCHVNKGLVFSSSKVKNLIKEKKVVLVRADWTNQDPVISQALASYGKAGVPLNVLYNPSAPDDPHIFPTILTAGTVINVLKRL